MLNLSKEQLSLLENALRDARNYYNVMAMEYMTQGDNEMRSIKQVEAANVSELLKVISKQLVEQK